MQLLRKDLQSSRCCSVDNEKFKKIGEEILGKEITNNQQLLKFSIFSPDRFVRDFLKGMLVFQGYTCVDVADLQGLAWDLSLHQEQVVFLDGLYLVGSEAENIRSYVQQFTQAGGQVVVLANRPGDAALMAIQNTGGCQVMWKPLDYRQVGQVMVHI